MFKIGVILMALTATLFGNWFTDLFDRTPTPTIKIPVDLSKAGTIVDTVFRVNYKESTRFTLDFECKDVKIDGGKDCKEMQKFLGLNSYCGKDKKLNKPDYKWAKHLLGDLVDKDYDLDGTRIPLHIMISQIEEDSSSLMILDKEYKTKGENGCGSGRYITSEHLKNGKYRLKIENLNGFEELKNRTINLRIQSTYRK